MKNSKKVLSTIALLSLCSLSSQASSPDIQSTANDATSSLNEIMSTPNTSIPTDLLRSAQCIANIHLIKGGFVWGARLGRGLVSCRTQNQEWSDPVVMDLGSASWGPQIGVEVFDLTLVFTNHNARRSLENGNLTLDAAGGLAVGPAGRDLSAGTNYKLKDTIYSYSRTRGLFIGVSLEGSILSPDKEYNAAAYGAQTPAQIFSGARDSLPNVFLAYINALEKYSM